LFTAVSKSDATIVAALLKAKINVQLLDRKGETPLFGLVKGGNRVFHIVKLLTSAGVDVNTVNHDGLSALHVAIVAENMKLVDSLCKCGADVDQTALDLNLSEEIQEILDNHLLRIRIKKIALSMGLEK
jgi:ankyrin repeat protein